MIAIRLKKQTRFRDNKDEKYNYWGQPWPLHHLRVTLPYKSPWRGQSSRSQDQSHYLAKKVSKCSKEGRCKDKCPLYGKSPLGPCLIWKREGHWKWDWPGPSPAWKRNLVICLEEPQVTLDVAGRTVIFLSDTRATYSVLTDFPGPWSFCSCVIMGLDGWPKLSNKPPTTLSCLLGSRTFTCQFLLRPEHAFPLLGRDLFTKFETRVQFGELYEEATLQEKWSLLHMWACLSLKPEGVSPPPQVDSQGNPTVCDAEIFGGATAVRLLLETEPREAAVGQSLQIWGWTGGHHQRIFFKPTEDLQIVYRQVTKMGGHLSD